MTAPTMQDTAQVQGMHPQLHGLPLYLVVDPYFGDPPSLDIDAGSAASFEALASLRRNAWGRDVHLSTWPAPVIEPAKLPYLVALQGERDRVLSFAADVARQERQEAIESQCGVYRMGALLETALAPIEAIDWLRRMWTTWVNGKVGYLRMADPRVFEMLTHLFDAPDLAAWLGPLAHWYFPSRNGAWCCRDGAAADSETHSEDEVLQRAQRLQSLACGEPTLDWTPQRKARLAHSEFLSRALGQLQAQALLVEPGHYPLGWRALERARRHGLRDPGDLVALCRRVLLDPAFEQGAACEAALAVARAQPGSFEACAAQTLARQDSQVASR